MIVVENADSSRHVSMAEINNEIKKQRTVRASIVSENVIIKLNNELERSNTECFGQQGNNNYLDDIQFHK